MSSAAFFSGANESEMTGQRAPKLGEYKGTHVLKVLELRAFMSRKSKAQKPVFAADFEVVKTTNPDLAPGDKAGVAFLKNPEWPDFYFSDIRRLLAGIGFAGGVPEDIQEKHMGGSVSDKQPAKGKLVGVKVGTEIKDGTAYPTFDWFAANDKTEVGPVNQKLAAAKPAANDDDGEAANTDAEPQAGDDNLFG